MKKLLIITLLTISIFALSGCNSLNYKKAVSNQESGNYKEALEIFTELADYEDSKERAAICEKEIMYQTYADVFEALEKDTWYFNGGTDTTLNEVKFTKEKAIINQVMFDGNGRHDAEANECDYLINDENIIVTLSDGNELSIKYMKTSDSFTLGNGDYLTLPEVDAGLQGYWNYETDGYDSVFKTRSANKYNAFINNGKIITEHAAYSILDNDGTYFYYGPYEGDYTLNFGGFNTEMMHGNNWFFNIINGKPTLLYYGSVCKPANGLPGENGYAF